ncbi:acyltransferase family protein [Bernardetia sp.]|uniref:acyltransferase family protein n=1 Tax=Bernardetia sp. TaxID=1937974 RepID=UPI0025BC87B1|nr:acyltransferase [Bernardetia sp.]
MILADNIHTKSNSLGFLRSLLASIVVVHHAFRLRSNEPYFWEDFFPLSFGTLGVYGFFVISGYLITASFEHSSSTVNFVWRRLLRIFPAFWICLLLTIFLFAPLTHYFTYGSLENYFTGFASPPLSYFYKNIFLSINQIDINNIMQKNVGAGNMLGAVFNGSLWTLIHEFRLYIITALIGIVAFYKTKKYYVFYIIYFLYVVVHYADPVEGRLFFKLYTDKATIILPIYFFAGSTLYLLRNKIKINYILLSLAILITIIAHYTGLFYYIFPFSLTYILIWLAVKLPFKDWERKYGDYSYGIYIYHFVIQQSLLVAGFTYLNTISFFLLSFCIALFFAYLSWKLIEKPSLKLKNKFS